MSQDILADALNNMINAKKSGNKTLVLHRHSKLLLSVLAIAKMKGHVIDYKVEGINLKITLGRLNNCSAVKPRFAVTSEEIQRYVRRYLPAKNIGTVIVSTSQGLMTHQIAQEKKIGGSILAYMY